jgi:hypothetical protein
VEYVLLAPEKDESGNIDWCPMHYFKKVEPKNE